MIRVEEEGEGEETLCWILVVLSCLKFSDEEGGKKRERELAPVLDF